MAMTIDTIVGQVFEDLRDTDAGQRRVRDIDKLVGRLNATADSLRQKRTTLHPRPGISFSVNTTQANRNPLEISVRVHGVDCGLVVFDEARMFSPSKKNFGEQWSSDKRTVDQKASKWGEPAVAAFIKACTSAAHSRNYARLESSIQDLLFQAMSSSRTKETLRGFRPVLFGGVPIQIPSPVAPRGSKEKGAHKGHSDVLARTLPHGRLVVFEVKRPAANRGDCIDALTQAVKYAAALDYLMNRDKHRSDYWRLFETRRGQQHTPRFSAIAFLDADVAGEKYDADLRAEVHQLLSANSRDYGLSVMFYRRVSDRIVVVREISRT